MSDNLLKIGTSAILANSMLLNTTSNNIANINSTGYVRQRTEFEAQILGLGVGRGTTDRLISDFTLKQLRRDTSVHSFSLQYLSEANRVDALFSNPANSIATNINDLFKQIQTANNEPATPANRGLIIGSAQAMLDQFNTLSTQVLDQEKFVNQQLQLYVTQTNGYIEQIANLNKEIAAYGSGSGSRPIPLDLLDKRDQAIMNLSQMMEIKVLDAENGEKLIFTSTGQALVMEKNDFNLIGLRGNPDASRLELQVEWSGSANITRNINVKELGGKLGALVAFREDVLDPTQNQLGQLALSIADAMNTQNRLGMNLNGEIGKDLFVIPDFDGLPYPANTGGGSITMTIEPGQGKNLPPNDFRVTVIDANNVRIEALDVQGNVISGSAKDVNIPGGFPATIGSDDAGGDLYGLSITIDGAPAAGDRFMLKPLASASRVMTMATTRPEDIALASPIRTEINVNNLGNGQVSGLNVTNTDASSSFTSPAGLDGGPWTMAYIGGNSFEIRDNTNTVIGTANFTDGNYQNVLAQAGLGDAGFDFSVSGVPQIGDTFTIAYNTGGFNDNRNGLALAGLQEADTTRLNALSVAGGVNYSNFNQAYGAMVSLIGERTSQARSSEAASAAVLEQTNKWYESLSGVSLDEEASNLIRFQQTYAAAAKILSTSQTVFDTLLSSLS
ncbi:flagellar hook-associated protein FlgK [Chromatiaceae bacterium AAb-1]|nr:flagellar hook-associated protein FlgK [Chromatiaceae bacterium AAb-1]